MALNLTPEEHDANPPSTWTVRKHGRKWALCNKEGHVMSTEPTKRQAEALKSSGFYFELYQKEGRWFRGEPVYGWKPYAPRVSA